MEVLCLAVAWSKLGALEQVQQGGAAGAANGLVRLGAGAAGGATGMSLGNTLLGLGSIGAGFIRQTKLKRRKLKLKQAIELLH